MKKFLILTTFLAVLLSFFSCEEKPEIPILTTSAISEIGTVSAIAGGVITNNGGATVTSKGICWGITDDPSTSDNKTVENGESATFSCNLDNLSPKTLYYVRSYATNSAGTGYGESVTFTTLGDIPGTSSISPTNIAIDSARINGTVNPNSLSTDVTFEWGTTTSYGNMVSLPNPVTGNTPVNVNTKLTNLTPGTIYHYRIKAINSLGTTYSSDITFTTLGSKPTVVVSNYTNLQLYSITLNGQVNPNYLSTTVVFEFGTSTNYENTITASPSPVMGNSDKNISVNLTELAPGTIYHYRINATNALGSTFSNDMTFKTLGDIPTVIAKDPSDIQYTTVTLKGSVNPNYFASSVSFQWGLTTNYGNSVVALQNPVVAGTSSVNVSADISGLTQGTTYHFRVVATNVVGTSYSNDFTFITLAPIRDIDGNEYDVKSFGSQVWMIENLKTTKYSNGDAIGTTSPVTLDISGESSPKYQWAYEGDESKANLYGRLYTGYAALDNRNICPTGWHLPSDSEWTTFTNYLTDKGYGYEGSGDDIAKSMASKTLWYADPIAGNIGNDISSNNASEFSVLPAGSRSNDLNVDGIFVSLGYRSCFWTSTELTSNIAWQRIFFYSQKTVDRTYSGGKQYAISIRCLKN